ncbi:zinc ribbon domain-containing protein [Gimesia algae]|uniref:Double zinc ribbon n=1 Tax=Gimesia algae TaxID=2527971 RepID=A0A517VC92_9PLAN|nr:zinc ribbon domain-containing protein [Gimesia algae]QDT90616.1 Double zinc ribbon [Gimesia algae]
MTIEFSCSHCNKVLKTSDDKAGRRAKCPQCGEPILVPATDPSAPMDDGFDGFDQLESGTPVPEDQSFLAEGPVREEDSFLAERPVREEDSFLSGNQMDCPMCGESIPADSKRCQHCGETLQKGEWVPRKIKIGEVFSRTWEVYKANLGSIIGIHIIAYVLYAVGATAVFMVLGAIAFAGALVLAQADPGLMIAGLIAIYILAILLVYSIVFYLMLGVMNYLLKLVKNEYPGIGEIFSGGPFLGRMVLCSIVFILAYSAGLICLIIPGLIVVCMFWPYAYLLIDRDLPGIDAFTESRKVTDGNKLTMFLIYLIMTGITMVPYVLMLATMTGMQQPGGQASALGLLILFGFVALFYLLLIPFSMLLNTVSYAEMTNQ